METNICKHQVPDRGMSFNPDKQAKAKQDQDLDSSLQCLGSTSSKVSECKNYPRDGGLRYCLTTCFFIPKNNVHLIHKVLYRNYMNSLRTFLFTENL